MGLRLYCAELVHSNCYHKVWWDKEDGSVWISTKDQLLKGYNDRSAKDIRVAADMAVDILHESLGFDGDYIVFPSVMNWNYFIYVKKYRLTRNVKKSEGELLTRDWYAGEELYGYHGPTHGCVLRSSQACCVNGDPPFFDLPKNALMEILKKVVKNPYHPEATLFG